MTSFFEKCIDTQKLLRTKQSAATNTSPLNSYKLRQDYVLLICLAIHNSFGINWKMQRIVLVLLLLTICYACVKFVGAQDSPSGECIF